MIEILTFSQRLNKLLQSHDLAPNQLAAATGCTRTEIRRLLTHEGTETQRRTLFEKLQNCGLFAQEELDLLCASLKISKIGVEHYRFQYAIEHILTGRTPDIHEEIQILSGGTLTQRLHELQNASSVDIFCLNSCFPALFNALNPLFKSPERKLRMKHYIFSEAYTADSAAFVAVAFPLLFDPRYEPYSISMGIGASTHPVGGNIVSIRARYGDEYTQLFFNLFDRQTAYEMADPAASDLFSYMEEMFQQLRPVPQPLREPATSKEDFASLCMTFLSHELNRATYSLTQDLCFQQTPFDIALAAFKEKSHFPDEEIAALIDRTASIHEQRYQNLYHKKKPSYMIMTLEGCRNFLATGCTTDHFVGFRPFSPEERKRIFKEMLENGETNPYYFPLLLKENTVPYHYNMECYEKLGVSFDVKDTNYDITHGYRSVFLMYPEFTSQCMAYYQESLIADQCYSAQDSLRKLKEIYHDFLWQFNLAG